LNLEEELKSKNKIIEDKSSLIASKEEEINQLKKQLKNLLDTQQGKIYNSNSANNQTLEVLISSLAHLIILFPRTITI